MSSAAEKKAAKRRAKKEAAQNHAAISAVEAVAAGMAVPGAANMDTTTAGGDATAADPSASSSSASAGAPVAAASSSSSSDPRVLLKERGNKAFTEKNMAEAIRYFTAAIEAPAPADTDVDGGASAASAGAAASAAAPSAAPAAAAAAPSPPPFLASVYSNRSAAYAAVYEWAAALRDADTCVQLAPHWSKGYFRQGSAYEGLMKLQAAAERYAAGLRVDPRDAVLLRQHQHVSSMLQEVERVTPEQAPENPEEDKYETMINWLIEGKSRFPALYLKYYSEDYRGVHAMSRVSKDDIVLEVPLSHIMTSEVAKASAIGQQLLASGVELNSTHSYLACYIMQERRNPNSFWKPYLDVLPQAYRNMPIFFTREELGYLKGSFSLGKIADRHAELKEEYDSIVKHIPTFGQYSLQEFVWARTVVITRIFGLMINNNKTDGLVPMADMLNHKRPRETSWTYDDTRSAFTITALRGLEQGQQIYDSYGRKCNSRFFVNYGFSLEANEDNQAVMWFTLPPSDPHFSMKVRLLGNSKIGLTPGAPKRFQIPVVSAEGMEDVTKECFAFLRFVQAKDSELLLLSSNERFDVRKIDAISLRNELEVVQDLAIAAQTSLSQFDTTLEEDNRLLAQEGLTNNIRNAVLMRRGEKEVLNYYAQLATEVQAVVNMPRKDFKRWLIKRGAHNPKPTPFDAYIDSIIVPLIKTNH